MTSSTICAGDGIKRVFACFGDTGGPLLVQIPPYNQWHLAGIVSWNEFCKLIEDPLLFSRVNHNVDWIQSPTLFTRIISFSDWVNSSTPVQSPVTSKTLSPVTHPTWYFQNKTTCTHEGKKLNHGDKTFIHEKDAYFRYKQERVCDRGMLKPLECK